MSRVTLKDIAEKSDVSIGTVSRVLSCKADVHPDYVRRVREAADALGYNKSIGPKNISQSERKPANFGLLINKPSSHDYQADEYEAGYLEALANHLNQQNIHLLFEPCGQAIDQDQLPKMVENNCVDGVIIKNVGSKHTAWVRRIAEHVPTVVMGAASDAEYIGVNAVLGNSALAMHQAVAYVQSIGHQRVGFFNVVNTGINSIYNQQRSQGFREAIPRLGMAMQPGYFQEPLHDNAVESFEAVAHRVLEAWLAMGPEKPTAIICASDGHALAILDACKKLNVAVPQEMTVIGFGNTRMGSMSHPPLTSMGYPQTQTARLIVELLQQVVEDTTRPPHQVLVSAQVIERQSHRILADQ